MIHTKCLFCGKKSESTESEVCFANDNFLAPDTVGNKPHGYVADYSNIEVVHE